VARLKIMCDLDISERRKPQDGKIKFKKFAPLDIELRVATLPTTGGRRRGDAHPRAGEPIPLDKLGVLPTNLERKLKRRDFQALRLFFVCGPDRLRQDHHAALHPELHQHPGYQDLDGRGPGRDHPEGLAPGAGQQEGRDRLRRP
jgi:hypothetical protein